MIDRDVGAGNILLSGNLNHFTTTSFVKIDYGRVISIDSAQRELICWKARKEFCYHGINVES